MRRGITAVVRHDVPPRPSFTSQWLATVQRSAQQMRRNVCLLLSLLVVPLLFIAVIVILTQLFRSRVGEHIYTMPFGVNGTVSLPTLFAVPGFEKLLFCYDPALTTTIPGLAPCVVPPENRSCAPASANLPVSGLCLPLAGDRSWSLLVLLYSNALLGRLMDSGSLDGIIAMQWASQVANAGDDRILPFVTAMSSLGFGVTSSTRYTSMRCSGLLYFAPADKVPPTLIATLNQTSSFFRYVYGGTFETVEEAEAHIADGSQANWGLIEINDLETNFDVVIRLNGTALPPATTKVNTDFSGNYLYDSAEMYIASGFVALEKTLLDFFVASQTDKGVVLSTTYSTGRVVALTASMPQTAGHVNYMQQIAGPVVGFIVVLAFMYPFSHMVQALVLEKELRIREAVQIMGVRRTALYAAHLTTYLLLCVVMALLIVVMFRLGVTSRSDPFVLLLILLVYLVSLITLASMVASWFSSLRLATQLAPLIYFVMGMPVFALGFSSGGLKIGLSILSPTALASVISNYLVLSSGSGFGPAAFQNPYLSPRPAVTMIVLAADGVLYGLLSLYFDAVLPRQWGTPKHPLFFVIGPFRRLRACCTGEPKKDDVPNADTAGNRLVITPGMSLATHNTNGAYDDDTYTTCRGADFNDHEAVAGCASRTHRQACVEFRGIVKQYKRDGETFNALDHLCLSLYEHEISVLLGPNGAGKSTLVDIVTGMVRPDGGDAIVCGHSVTAELGAVRQCIGLCPQHNVLWEELTCCEHLEYFGKIKGLRGAALGSRVMELLDAVGLLEKAHQPAKELSGGQKRKLSVAIAFVGREGLVILDEPTAGMDAGARRHTWKLLRELSKTTTILLTTHFMDEADLLGDRVALINRGRLQCCGSSLFLKSRLGGGYTVRAELRDFATAKSLLQRLQGVVARVELFSFSGREAQYSVPRSAVDQMPELLRVLEQPEAARGGVEGFAVSGSTLEEVFLRTIRLQAREEAARAVACSAKPPSCLTGAAVCDPLSASSDTRQTSQPLWLDGPAPPDTASCANTHEPAIFPVWDESELIFDSGGRDAVGRTHAAIRTAIQRAWSAEMESSRCRVWLSQFSSAWRKRWLCALRDRKLQFFQVICPVICVLIAMLLQLVTSSNHGYLQLQPSSIAPQSQTIASLCTDWFGTSTTALDAIDPGTDVTLMSFRGSTDLSHYMLDTWFNHTTPRFSAIQCDDRQLRARVRAELLLFDTAATDALADVISNSRFLTTLHNTSSSHSVAIGMQEFFSFLLANNAARPDAVPTVRVATHAMPSNAVQRRREKSGSVMLIAIVLCIPFVLLPSTPVGWVVKERQCKARHIQRLSGLTMSAYWLGNLAFDFAAYVITCVLVTLLLTAFRRLEYIGTHALGGFVVGLAANGLCSTLYSYALSFLFHEHATASLGTMVFNMLTGVILAIVIMVLSARQQLNGESTAVVDYVCFGLRVFPCFSLSEFLLNLASFRPVYETVGGTVWTWKVIGYPCLYMAAEVPFFAMVLLVLEQPCTLSSARKLRDLTGACVNRLCCCGRSGRRRQGDASDTELDSDVEAEANAVQAADATDDPEGYSTTAVDPVRVVKLVKAFGRRPRVLAVNDVSFAIRRDEIFSLLGTNGAGKTTTISVLCQEQFPTSGHVRVERHDTRRDRDGAMRKVGYCPQFDATLDLLTVREHLMLYAGIRGVVPSARENLLCDLMQVCGLTPYRNVVSAKLSGGNRRKLSVAIALMGAPSVVCLDEPSAGMDPVARRDLWTAVENIAGQHTTPTTPTSADGTKARCSVLLTTHHLEEVEALADRVGIMSRGKLRCMGTLAHLKRKFGTGYQLELRVASPTGSSSGGADREEEMKTMVPRTHTEPPMSIAQHIVSWFPGAVQSENFFGERLIFQLPAESTRLSEVFALLGERGRAIGITDYIVAHTSIEQVFLRFCSEDAAPLGELRAELTQPSTSHCTEAAYEVFEAPGSVSAAHRHPRSEYEPTS